MISVSALATMAVTGVLGIALPVGAAVWWCRSRRQKFRVVLAGALTFVVFAQVLEGALHAVCLMGNNAVSTAIQGSPVLYMLYGAFAAGIFEETGRFAAFSLVLRKYRGDRRTALTCGIGHAGIEVVLVAGVSMLLYFAVGLAVNASGMAGAVSILGSAGTAEATVQSLTAMTPLTGVYALLERFSACLLHLSCSVLVFTAVREKGRRWLYPLAILIHALFDLLPGLYQWGAVTSLALLEGVLLAASLALAFWAKRVYQSLPVQEEAVPESGPEA